MKKLIFLLVLSSYSFSIYSQGDFAPIGAKWFFPSPEDLSFFYALKDTILQNQNCTMIKSETYEWDKTLVREDSLFVFEENDSVYYFNQYYDKFILLYDFTAETGDTLGFLVPVPNNSESDSFHIIIDSVKTITINDVPLKHFYVNNFNFSNWHFDGGIIVENIGSLFTYFLPIKGIYIPELAPVLSCYQNEEQVQVQFFNAYACIFDILDSVDDLKELPAKVSIHPNPTTGQLHVELTSTKNLSKIIDYELFNLNGKLIYKGQSNTSEWDLDLSFLNKGLYLLKIRDLKEGSIYKKIMVF